jgi:lysyl-tRNA synthetase class 2
VDDAFYAALPAMPRCAGIALGVDRLVLALTGAPHIRAVQVR